MCIAPGAISNSCTMFVFDSEFWSFVIRLGFQFNILFEYEAVSYLQNDLILLFRGQRAFKAISYEGGKANRNGFVSFHKSQIYNLVF